MLPDLSEDKKLMFDRYQESDIMDYEEWVIRDYARMDNDLNFLKSEVLRLTRILLKHGIDPRKEK